MTMSLEAAQAAKDAAIAAAKVTVRPVIQGEVTA